MIRETRAYAGPSLTTQWIGVCLLSEFDAPRPSPERPASLSAISNGGEAFASYRFDVARAYESDLRPGDMGRQTKRTVHLFLQS
jgi:hypothetical protein